MSETTATATVSPSTGRIVVAVLLGILYGGIAFLPLFLVSTLLVAWVASSSVNGDLVVHLTSIGQNVVGLVFEALFIYWQVKREYKRARRRAQKP